MYQMLGQAEDITDYAIICIGRGKQAKERLEVQICSAAKRRVRTEWVQCCENVWFPFRSFLISIFALMSHLTSHVYKTLSLQLQPLYIGSQFVSGFKTNTAVRFSTLWQVGRSVTVGHPREVTKLKALSGERSFSPLKTLPAFKISLTHFSPSLKCRMLFFVVTTHYWHHLIDRLLFGFFLLGRTTNFVLFY